MYKVPRSDQKLPPPQGWKWRVIGWFTLFGAISGMLYSISILHPVNNQQEDIGILISGIIFYITFGSLFGGLTGLVTGIISSRMTSYVSLSVHLLKYELTRVFVSTSVFTTSILSFVLRDLFRSGLEGEPKVLPPLYWSSVVLAAISAVIIAWLMLRWLERANMKTDEVDSQVALN